ncbi:hypothetical protein TrRE_jg8243 [Triparma retinervis]|uniref:Uncharacterized protein n=1 Tax=Triparma retinervis TaxID=2557542 RepID=A0A9W6ZH82_9STRA|nr:hypothetical protein TrRE_jg8243 [Triparma retinervis]
MKISLSLLLALPLVSSYAPNGVSPKKTLSRSTFLTTTTTAALTSIIPSFLLPNPAFAKFGESIYVSPKDAVVDRDVLGSDGVKKSVDSLRGYQNMVGELKTKLKQDGQDTQRSIDRISRLIIQDVQELEAAAAFKGGGRSEIRRENVEKKLVKLEGAFGEILAFAA